MSDTPSPTDRAAHEARLVRERAEVARRLEGLDRTFDELVERADVEPADDEHDPDGTTAYERAQVSSLRAEMRARLAQLDEALADLDRDAYDRCTSCGGPIGAARLEVLPGTRVCVRCASS
ncbi:MAG: TraR/DksA C4-type zinc finger protein [Actinomycetota bacterium]|nr:TraR/DksA C4-type zinc finger protein [Actinomycetota bacterium]